MKTQSKSGQRLAPVIAWWFHGVFLLTLLVPQLCSAELEPIRPIWRCKDVSGRDVYTNVKADAEGHDCTVVDALWLPFSETTSFGYYVNRRSIARAGASWKMWTLVDYVSRQKAAFYPFMEFQSLAELKYYNCAERTIADVQSIYYASEKGKGDIVHSAVVKPNSLVFSDSPPASIGDQLIDYVCDAAEKMKKKPSGAAGKAKK